MLKSIRLNRRRMIELPSKIFHPLDLVAILSEGNTVIIKKMTPSKLTEFADKKSGQKITLKEITKEIQVYRKEKKK